MEGAYVSGDPKTICQHGSDGNVLIFDTSLRKISVDPETDRSFTEQTGIAQRVPLTEYVLTSINDPDSGITDKLIYKVDSGDLTHDSFAIPAYASVLTLIQEE
jgi:hypothetical protein